MEAELLQKRSHALASRQDVKDDKVVATWEWRHGDRPVCSDFVIIVCPTFMADAMLYVALGWELVPRVKWQCAAISVKC